MAATADAQELRAALKQWEHDFFAVHGHKPARADIKSNREMAEKYKLYDQLTRKPAASKPKERRHKERKSEAEGAKRQSPTGSKRKRESGGGISIFTEDGGTPRKSSRRSSGKRESNSLEATSADPYDPPLNNFFSPAPMRTYVGPTPQKNGQVLGLFDLLSPESARKSSVAMTPSRRNGSQNVLLSSLQGQASPSKNATVLAATPSSRSRMGPPAQTPSKVSEAGLPGGVLTPSRSRANVQLQRNEHTRQADSLLAKLMTPSTQRAKKLDLDETPEFLKRRRSPGFRPSTSTGVYRDNANGQDENAEAGQVKMFDDADGLMNISWSPIAVRQPRRPIGRSFSQIIRANRKAEEEKYEDDLDVLREMEQQNDNGNSSHSAAGTMVRKLGMTPKTGSTLSNEPLGTDISPEALATASNKVISDPAPTTEGDPTAPEVVVDYLPLGADGEAQVNRDGDEGEDHEQAGAGQGQQQPRRFRKKGPKRQTRKFNLAPRTAKWQPEPEWTAGMENDDEPAEQPDDTEQNDVDQDDADQGDADHNDAEQNDVEQDEADHDESQPQWEDSGQQYQDPYDVPAAEPIQIIGSKRSQDQWADVPSDVEENFADSAYGGSSDKFSSPPGGGLARKVTKLGSGTKGAARPTKLGSSTTAAAKAPAAGSSAKSAKQGPAKQGPAGAEKDKAKTKAKTERPAKATEKKKKMVSATAHANYRTLRIKNRNSKAKRGGRFGRRRG